MALQSPYNSRKRVRSYMTAETESDKEERIEYELRLAQRRQARQAMLAQKSHLKTQQALRTTYADATATTSLDLLPGEIWTIILRYAGTTAQARLCRTAKSVASRIVHRNATHVTVPWQINVARMARYEKLTDVTIQKPRVGLRFLPDLRWMSTSHLATTLTSLTVMCSVNALPHLPNLRVLYCLNANLAHLIASKLVHLQQLHITNTLKIPLTAELDDVEWHMPHLEILYAPSLRLDKLTPPTHLVQLTICGFGAMSKSTMLTFPSVKILRLENYSRRDYLHTRFPSLVALFTKNEFSWITHGHLPRTLRVLGCRTIIPCADMTLPTLKCLLTTTLPSREVLAHLNHVELLVSDLASSVYDLAIPTVLPRLRHVGSSGLLYLPHNSNSITQRASGTLQVWHACMMRLDNRTSFRAREMEKLGVKFQWHHDLMGDMQKLALAMIGITSHCHF